MSQTEPGKYPDQGKEVVETAAIDIPGLVWSEESNRAEYNGQPVILELLSFVKTGGYPTSDYHCKGRILDLDRNPIVDSVSWTE